MRLDNGGEFFACGVGELVLMVSSDVQVVGCVLAEAELCERPEGYASAWTRDDFSIALVISATTSPQWPSVIFRGVPGSTGPVPPSSEPSSLEPSVVVPSVVVPSFVVPSCVVGTVVVEDVSTAL